jgi:transposase
VVSCSLSGGNVADSTALQNLWAYWQWDNILMVIADKGYDTNAIRTLLHHQQVEAVIPSKKNRKLLFAYNEQLYRLRSKIENFFGRYKENIRLCLRKDKLDQTLLSFLALAIIKLELRLTLSSP